MKALNRQQLTFVKHYQRSVADGKPNATQAYLDAGYKCSRASAEAAAARLLGDVRVQQLLAPVQQAAEIIRTQTITGIEITRDRIRLEMARLSFVNPKSLYHTDGRLKAIHELDDDTAAAIASVEVEEETDEDGTVTRTKKIKMWDKNRALMSLADTEAGVWAEDAKEPPPPAGTTNVNITVVNRIEQFAAAFAGAADREEAGHLPGDGTGKPLDTRPDQGRTLPQAS